MSGGNGSFVSWGRYDAEHQAILGRLDELEGRWAQQAADAREAATVRRGRTWMILIAVLSGLVCPVAVTAIITILHLSTG